MKKLIRILSVLLASVLFGSVCPSSLGVEDAGIKYIFNSEDSLSSVNVRSFALLQGDVNVDSRINTRDLLAIKRFISGSGGVSVERITTDTNGDGRINSMDLRIIKKAIASEEYISVGNTPVLKSYDSTEEVILLTANAPVGGAAFFEVPLSLAVGSSYCTVTIKGEESLNVFIECDDATVDDCTAVTSVEGGEYTSYVFSLTEAVSATDKSIVFEYDTTPSDGETACVDSVSFFATEAEAAAFADERAALRTPSEAEHKYVEIKFDSAAPLSNITAKNNTTATYDSGYNALKLQITGSNADPWALFDLESYNISADEYKYIVYTSMIPSTSGSSTEAELFYAAGNITQPTAGYSNVYTQMKDAQFHSKIFEMTNAAFWTGKVHSLRFDYYCSEPVGSSQYVKSLIFCNTYEAAAAVAENREVLTKETKELFFYGKYDDGDFKLSYRMYVPYSYDSSNDYPVLMLLHGAGERGDNGTYHLTQGFPYMFKDTSNAVFGAIVMAPQCPTDMQWVDTPWSQGSYSVDSVPESRPLGAAMSVLNNIFENYSTDRDRVYVSGISMGGFGTWDCLARHSDIFAAGIPICGAADPSKANVLKDIQIKTYHGTADNIVPARGTKEVYDAIIAAGGTKISYTPIVGGDHFIWDGVYEQAWLSEWLLMQRLSDR